jgi:beta-lactamase regulating signal transducer with metallopeptidase domain
VGIGTSLFLIATGAILYFAVDASVQGLEIQTVGVILMVIGVLGLLISLFVLMSASRSRYPDDRPTRRDRDF